MDFIAFLNQHWESKASGNYKEPAFDYIKEYSYYFGGGESMFLYFILLFYVDSNFAKEAKWSDLSEDFQKIYYDKNNFLNSIDLPEEIVHFLKKIYKKNLK